VAGGAGTLVDVDLATRSGKSGGAEALRPMVDGDAESAVLAESVGAKDVLAVVLRRRSASQSLLSRVALEAGPLAAQGLEEIDRARSARSKAGVGVVAGGTHRSALSRLACARLEGELVGRARRALLESVAGGFTGVSVAGTLQARHESGRAVGSVAANGNAGRFALGSHVLSPGAGRAGLAASLPRLILVSML